MMNSLALFGLKQASLHEIGYCLHREKSQRQDITESKKQHAIGSPPLHRRLQYVHYFTL